MFIPPYDLIIFVTLNNDNAYINIIKPISQVGFIGRDYFFHCVLFHEYDILESGYFL